MPCLKAHRPSCTMVLLQRIWMAQKQHRSSENDENSLLVDFVLTNYKSLSRSPLPRLDYQPLFRKGARAPPQNSQMNLRHRHALPLTTSFPGYSLYFEKVPWLRLVTCLSMPTQAAPRVGPQLNFVNTAL